MTWGLKGSTSFGDVCVPGRRASHLCKSRAPFRGVFGPPRRQPSAGSRMANGGVGGGLLENVSTRNFLFWSSPILSSQGSWFMYCFVRLRYSVPSLLKSAYPLSSTYREHFAYLCARISHGISSSSFRQCPHREAVQMCPTLSRSSMEHLAVIRSSRLLWVHRL